MPPHEEAPPPGPRAGSVPPGEPLEREEFRAWTQPAGPAGARLDLGGLAVDLHGIPGPLAEALAARFAPWVGAVSEAGDPLRIEVVDAGVDYFIPPSSVAAWETYRVLTAYDGAIVRGTSYRLAYWFDVRRGVGQAALARGERDPAPRALENFLRCAIAWLAVERGGLFLHGAGIVRDGRCHLFYGPSGAGKSTLSALSREGRVISDDLTLLLRRPEGLCAVGGPFRGTYTGGGPVSGVFPVAGLYRLRKDDRTFVRSGDAACFADLLGNLPWVVDQFARHPELMDRVRTVIAGVPLAYLHFRRDADFWPAIDRGPDQRTSR